MKVNFRLLQAIARLQKQTKEQIDNVKEEQNELKEKQSVYSEEQELINNRQNELETRQEILSNSQDSLQIKQEEIKELTDKIKEKVEDIKINMPKDGRDGKNGKDGARGPRGERGLTGLTGPRGERGPRGESGTDGIGIYDIKINEDDHLIVTLTDGRKIDCGYARGRNGMNGQGINGISVIDAEIRNGHLYIKLSNGREIDAGVVSGGSGGEEVDPIFTASPAYNITNQDISNWNNKSDFSGSYNDLEDKPELFSGDYNDLEDKPELFSGDYNDLDNKPTIPTVPTNVSAFTNDAGYLTEHQSLSGYATEQWVENQGYLTQHQDISGKYDKTGGEITGNVKIDGTLTLDIEDEDYDAGIRFDKELNTNLGTILTLTGYANSSEQTNYKPIIRNIGTPHSDYDVANKKYVDDNLIVPNYYLTLLNADGTVDTTTSTLNYNTVLSNLTNRSKADYLDLVWGTTRFYAKCIEVTDVNTGDLKFIGEVEYQGIQRYMVFTLNSSNVLTTTNIITFESVSNKVQSVVSNSTSIEKYPSTKAVFDEFQRKPVVVWESNDPTTYLKGIQADISASPAWQLTNLDLTPFKRIKIYSCAGQGTGISAGNSTTSAMILEMSLDSRASISAYGGNYVGSIISQKPNNRNRLATLTCAVSADKTSFVVLAQTNLYGTGETNNNDVNANVFMIEGYYD